MSRIFNSSHLRKTTFFLLIISFVLSIYFLFNLFVTSRAATVTYTTKSDWDGGILTDIETQSNPGSVALLPQGTWGPRNLHMPPNTISLGGAYVSDGTYIYITRGNRSAEFWRYHPSTDSWDILDNLPYGMYAGSDITLLDGYIYAIFGSYQDKFARYNITENTWEDLQDFPDLVYEGGSIVNDGTYIYGIQGNNTDSFYRYDPGADTWSPLTNTPANIRNAGELTYISGYIYTARGANTDDFYRYSISGDSWSSMADVPSNINDQIETTTDGSYIYYPLANNTTTFYRYNVAGNSWETLSATPDTVRDSGGPIYHSGDGDIYFMRGNNQRNFWKYDITADEFEGPADPPFNFDNGSDLVYHSGYIYAARGSNQDDFARLDISTNTWESLSDVTNALTDDTKGIAAGSYLYFYRGNNTTDFYRYDPSGDSWSTMTAAPSTVRYGGTLSYPGSGDYIYGTRGNNQLTFWRYSISGNSWDDGAVTDLPSDAEAIYGARLISDGTDIFYFGGYGDKRFFKYDIGGNSWSEVASVPFAPYWGTDIAYGNGTFVAIAGNYDKSVWEYNIADDSWRQLPDMSGYDYYEYGTYDGASVEYDGSTSFYITRGRNLSEITTFTQSAGNYPTSGTWTSASEDLLYVDAWTSLSDISTTPSDSSVTLETRSSTDNNSWSSWQATSGSTIQSPVRRYLQIRATLNASTDQAATPALQSISLEYTGDEITPNNPSSITATSQEIGGEPLSDGESYVHTHPYFSWSGATDTETDVAGYFVYFGTSASADPETLGIFQTATDYVTTEAMSAGTYYLRIKTKDLADNISAATTLFTYVYAGVSPPTTLTQTTTAHFSGTTSDTNVTNNEIKLAGKSGFWQQELLSSAPAGMQWGAKNMAYVSSSNTLYALQGANNTNFYSYDIANDTWNDSLANAPASVRMGGGVVEGPSGYLYGLQGNNSTAFWRYDIAGDSWSDGAASDTPDTVYYGGSMIYDGSRYIYMLRGNNTGDFWKYDTQGEPNPWDITLSEADFGDGTLYSDRVYVGGNLTYDGSGTLYAIQGNYLNGFSSYDIATDTWNPLPALPTLPYYSTIVYDATQHAIYYSGNQQAPDFYKYDIASQQWTQVNDSPLPLNYGTASRNINGNLYILRGGNSTDLYRYDTEKDTWFVPAFGLFGTHYNQTSLSPIYYGADIVRDDNGYLYLMRGYYSDDFVRYDPETGALIKMARLPAGSYRGASLEYVPGNEEIYYIPGEFQQKFYVYDIVTNTWTEESSDPPPYAFNYGSSMAYDGTQYIYATRGANQDDFYRFDPDGTPGAKWETLDLTPGGLHYGAEIVYDNGYVYTLRGANVDPNPFYRYDVALDTWSDGAVADLGIDVYNDGFLVNGNDGYLYAARGDNDVQWYRYSISSDSWTELENIPSYVHEGGAGISDLSHTVYAISGDGSSPYDDGVYTYIQETSSTSFETSGTYTSQSHDLGSIYQWGNIEVTFSENENTSIHVETRTSANDTDWSAWATTTEEKELGSIREYNINSPLNRYMQIRFTFTSGDNVYSAVIDDYTINYYQDTTAPSNPEIAGFTAYSDDSVSTELTDLSEWYNHQNAHFVWPDAEATNGATDSNGSGIYGYYVYLGTNMSADPEIAGDFQTETSYTASGLSSNQTYFLRIKAIDNAGNTASSTVTGLTYKYDASAPDAPSDVTSDPAGYSATNSFNLSWSAVSTGSGASVDEYCYKTGTSSGPYATDQCTTNTAISSVPSYRTGVNTFYVRTKDTAGNFSAYTTASYYYSATAPSPPQNLLVTPLTNTTNSFAFSWDPPANFSGDVNKLTYYYSVNSLPTEFSVNETAATSLSAGAFATLPGQNTFYVLAEDEAGNIDYNLYNSVVFSANTSAPGIPLAVEIADVSVKTTESWKIALSWEQPLSLGSGVDNYQIHRSIDGDEYELIASSKGISYVDTELVQQTYWYKIKACDSTNNCGEFSDFVSLYPDGRFTSPAELTSNPAATGISTRRATVSWTTNRTSDSRIAYGTSPGEYFDEEVSNSEHVTAHTLILNNLDPGTQYYYVALWTDEDGNIGESQEYDFTTDPPPTVSSVDATNISISSATVRFTVKDAVSVSLLYGQSTSYGGVEEIFTSLDESTYTVQLENLDDDTTYHYMLQLNDVEENAYTFEDHVFTTLPRPRIDNVQIQQVVGTAQPTVLISWNSNTEITSVVSYAPTTDPSQARDEVDLEYIAGEHQLVLSALLPQTQYNLIVRGSDRLGNEAVSDQSVFTTSSDTRPPRITNLQVETSISRASESGDSSAQLLVSWDTDELGTSQVEFGEGTGTVYSQRSQEDTTLATNHTVIISGLSPSKVYHLRAVSKDSAENTGYSTDTVTITPKVTSSALDLVISNLSEIFGFLRNL